MRSAGNFNNLNFTWRKARNISFHMHYSAAHVMSLRWLGSAPTPLASRGEPGRLPGTRYRREGKLWLWMPFSRALSFSASLTCIVLWTERVQIFCGAD